MEQMRVRGVSVLRRLHRCSALEYLLRLLVVIQRHITQQCLL